MDLDAARRDFRAFFDRVTAPILDASGRFSLTQAKSDLVRADELAASCGADSAERLAVWDMLSLVLSKAGDDEGTIDTGRRALGIRERGGAVAPLALVHLLLRIAEAASNLEDGKTAAAFFGEARRIAAMEPGLTPLQRLGIDQRYAIALLHAGDPAPARAVFEELLAMCERDCIAAGDGLSSTLDGLAQSSYSLGDLASAEAYLIRRVSVDTAAWRHEAVFDGSVELAHLYRQQRRIDEARESYQKARSAARALSDDAMERIVAKELSEIA